MSTPAQAVIAYSRALLIVFLCMGSAATAISRTYVFYESYSQFTLQRTEEAWLRERCKEADFYSNMRQHTDLCALVESRAREWVLLHALNTVCTTTHVCGTRPCIEYLNDLVVRGIVWPVVVVACLFVVMVPSIITSMASRSMCHAFDTRARRTPGMESHQHGVRALV